jgi:tRNA pseudouridine38-40 synthase
VKGSSFLTHEIRILAGTLLDLARGKRTLEGIARAFEGGKREGLGPTLPPHGLTLEWVKIPEWNWTDSWPTPHPQISLKDEEFPWL